MGKLIIKGWLELAGFEIGEFEIISSYVIATKMNYPFALYEKSMHIQGGVKWEEPEIYPKGIPLGYYTKEWLNDLKDYDYKHLYYVAKIMHNNQYRYDNKYPIYYVVVSDGGCYIRNNPSTIASSIDMKNNKYEPRGIYAVIYDAPNANGDTVIHKNAPGISSNFLQNPYDFFVYMINGI